jgi:Ca2+-binding RTX toxin-like protein
MRITLNYDSSVNSSPPGFATALQNAATMLDSIIKDPITITLDIGYGEDDGSLITGNTLAESQPSTGKYLTYSQLVADLSKVATSTDDNTFLRELPATDPTNDGLYFVSIAQEKALGLLSPISSEIDGYAGFSSTFAWDFDPTNGVSVNTIDLVGTALHEFTHMLGRIAPKGEYTAMDLLGYGPSGTLDPVNGDQRYLSIDGGKTKLVNFDTSSDPGDFASGSPFDPFDAQLSTGVVYPWTSLDSQLMDVLGYNVGAPPAPLSILDTTTGQPVPATAQPYTGPVSGLQNEYININSDSLNISVNTPNWFIHSGSGNDAIAAKSGINALDGGTGSNFLTGGSGTDTFFVDDRGPTADIWSTVNGFHVGDAATIWGVTPQDFGLAWVDGQGATGYTGLTLHATASGQPTASLTLAGFTQADMASGRLSVSFGTDPASGSAYMYVHANS